jgi:N-acetylmuramoyl-L-alanine amidase
MPDHGLRRARFMVVLRGQRRPAVLIEGGYLSNPREARRIADPAYRQKLAEAVAEVLAEEPETSAATSSTSDSSPPRPGTNRSALH